MGGHAGPVAHVRGDVGVVANPDGRVSPFRMRSMVARSAAVRINAPPPSVTRQHCNSRNG